MLTLDLGDFALYSYPLKEPGGYCLPVGGAGHALPGSNQTPWARVSAGGGGEGKTSALTLCDSML